MKNNIEQNEKKKIKSTPFQGGKKKKVDKSQIRK